MIFLNFIEIISNLPDANVSGWSHLVLKQKQTLQDFWSIVIAPKWWKGDAQWSFYGVVFPQSSNYAFIVLSAQLDLRLTALLHIYVCSDHVNYLILFISYRVALE